MINEFVVVVDAEEAEGLVADEEKVLLLFVVCCFGGIFCFCFLFCFLRCIYSESQKNQSSEFRGEKQPFFIFLSFS